jgi:hypothetical protein
LVGMRDWWGCEIGGDARLVGQWMSSTARLPVSTTHPRSQRCRRQRNGLVTRPGLALTTSSPDSSASMRWPGPLQIRPMSPSTERPGHWARAGVDDVRPPDRVDLEGAGISSEQKMPIRPARTWRPGGGCTTSPGRCPNHACAETSDARRLTWPLRSRWHARPIPMSSPPFPKWPGRWARACVDGVVLRWCCRRRRVWPLVNQLGLLRTRGGHVP